MSKTVLITGCSTGIGRAAAEKFQAEGWNVVATMRSTDKGADLASLDNVTVAPLDVTDDTSVRKAVGDAIEKHGKIDVVINNAGYGAVGPIEFSTDEKIARQYSTNVEGPLRVMRAVIPHMRKAGEGVIMNITSVGGRVAFPLNALYCGSKFALEGISESIRYELAPFGIRVKLIEPGAVTTQFMQNLDMSADSDSDVYQAFIQKVFAGFAKGTGGSKPDKIADKIFEAATDGTDRLRYPAGDDADVLMSARDKASDEQLFAQMNERFG